MIPYSHLHDKVYPLIKDGTLIFTGSTHEFQYADLDYYLLKMTGVIYEGEDYYPDTADGAYSLGTLVITRAHDFSWCEGPYFLTLLKMAILQFQDKNKDRVYGRFIL